MANLNFTGTISGLDTASLITAMLSAEKAPLSRIATQRTSLKSTQSAYGQLRTLLTALQSKAEAFTVSSTGGKRVATSSATSVLTATAAPGTPGGSYAVTVDFLASQTIARSTVPMGTAITPADLGSPMASLRLPGTVTAGKASVVVDGVILPATIGDPTTTTLGTALDAIAAKIQEHVRTNAGEETAVVSASIVDNRVQFQVTGGRPAGHAVAFGAGGDTSNVFGILGLAGLGTGTLTDAAPIVARNVLGVTSTSAPLGSSGLTSLGPGTVGTLVINGAEITYNTATDTLSAVVSRINASSAGVTASLDRGNDRLLLTSRTGGAAPIAISDKIDATNTATLAQALRLAPGTIAAQTLGRQAQVTIDGRTYTADTNKVVDAIPGVTMTLAAQGTSTITVAPDQAGVTSAISGFISAYNALADNLDALTENDPKKTRGTLASESGVRDLALSLRRTLTGQTGSGAYPSLASIGVTTGKAGAAVGTTARLQLDETKLQAALEKDPAAVADLLNGATGALAAAATTLKGWTTTGGRIDKSLETITSQLSGLDKREEQVTARIELRTRSLEAKFATLEKTLAQLQTVQGSISQQVTSMNKSSEG